MRPKYLETIVETLARIYFVARIHETARNMTAFRLSRVASLAVATDLLLSTAGYAPTGRSSDLWHHSPPIASFARTQSASSRGIRLRTGARETGRHASRVVPRFKHIVVVLEGARDYSDVALSPRAPYLTSLSAAGVRMTNSISVAPPNDPSFCALFSGSVGRADCSASTGPTATLATELRTAGRSFIGYVESPTPAGVALDADQPCGRDVTTAPDIDVPSSVRQPFSSFPSRFDDLPTVSFVIPNSEHNMQRGSIPAGDRWISTSLSTYARWSASHDSLLIVTFGGGDDLGKDRVLTVLSGANLVPGTDGSRITEFSVLRTIETAYALRPLGHSVLTPPITADWQT